MLTSPNIHRSKIVCAKYARKFESVMFTNEISHLCVIFAGSAFASQMNSAWLPSIFVRFVGGEVMTAGPAMITFELALTEPCEFFATQTYSPTSVCRSEPIFSSVSEMATCFSAPASTSWPSFSQVSCGEGVPEIQTKLQREKTPQFYQMLEPKRRIDSD